MLGPMMKARRPFRLTGFRPRPPRNQHPWRMGSLVNRSDEALPYRYPEAHSGPAARLEYHLSHHSIHEAHPSCAASSQARGRPTQQQPNNL